MPIARKGILDDLITEAVRLDATALEVEYNAGFEEVVVFHGGVGWGLRRFRSASPEAIALRELLFAMSKRKKHRVHIDGGVITVQVMVHDSFGEAAFRLECRRV